VKTVVIFTRTLDPAGYPFNDPYLWNGYLDLLLALKARGVAAYFASGNETYAGNGVFREAFTAETKVPVADFVKVTDIKADLVFEKGGFTGKDVLVINPEFVHNITASKSETYRIFSKYQPKSIICDDRKAVEAAFKEIGGELIVVKAPVSNKGQAVSIGKQAELLSALPEEFPLIVQEFVDTSVGIPGYVDGVHDLRVKIGGGKVFGGMIRTPAKGELRANLAQGGTARHLLPEEIPAEAIELAKEIDYYFRDYPRYYALDFARTGRGWKLIELNSKPGLSPSYTGEPARLALEHLADYLTQLI
jgi:glutathione synthase/RimK-type ligase-like ATP-grasp enzyme